MTPPLQRPLPREKITPRNTALLVVDMENDFVAQGAVMQTPGGLEIVPVINHLIAWARSWSVPVIFTQEMHRDDQSDYGIELEFDVQTAAAVGDGLAVGLGVSAVDGDDGAMTASSAPISISCCAASVLRTW